MKPDELKNHLPREIMKLLKSENDCIMVAEAFNQARSQLNSRHGNSFAGDLMRSAREVVEVAKKFIKTQEDFLRLLRSLPEILEMIPSSLVESAELGDYLVPEVNELKKASAPLSSLDDFLSLYRDPGGNGPYLPRKPGRMDYN